MCRMARQKRFTEAMLARFPEGRLARIQAVLRDGETSADLVRVAVDAELRRREQTSGQPQGARQRLASDQER